ncbi:hypothetical protein [uncultured Bradyrhizobium sp.]|uniref:hypothetical protein n=1 Tax=uncultured Bradyrhizobium sp. TaxID=199684 RepID=UPI0035CA2422
MVEPADMILPVLQEMRAETKDRFLAVDGRFDRIETRLQKMDEAVLTFRHALTGDSLPGKLVTGAFEARIERHEKKMREFEGRS